VEILRWLERVLVAQKRYTDALEISELARARAFAAELARRAIKGKDLASPSIAKSERSPRAQRYTGGIFGPL